MEPKMDKLPHKEDRLETYREALEDVKSNIEVVDYNHDYSEDYFPMENRLSSVTDDTREFNEIASKLYTSSDPKLIVFMELIKMLNADDALLRRFIEDLGLKVGNRYYFAKGHGGSSFGEGAWYFSYFDLKDDSLLDVKSRYNPEKDEKTSFLFIREGSILNKYVQK